MVKRPPGQFSYQIIHLLSVTVSIAVAIIAIINVVHNKGLNKPSLLVLIIGELISALSLPLVLLSYHSSQVIWMSFIISTTSSVLSLGAGLSLINFTISSYSTVDSPRLLISLIALIVASQFLHGLSLSTYINTFQHIRDLAVIETEESEIETLQKKVVSMKASAATLVDSRKTSGNQDSTYVNESHSLFQSAKPRLSSRQSLTLSSSVELGNVQKSNAAQFYSIKKLSVINQSSSSADITIPHSQSESSSRPIAEGPSTMTPLETITKNAMTAKNISMERDALKRIPSALLPPHLKPHTEKENQQLQQKQQQQTTYEKQLYERQYQQQMMEVMPLRTSRSQSHFHHYKLAKEDVPEAIPRAATVQDFFPSSHTDQTNGIKTISPVDFEKGFGKFQFNQLKSPLDFEKPTLKKAHFGVLSPPSDGEGPYDGRFISSEEDMIDDEDDVESNVSSSSTAEALRMVEDAQEKGSNEFMTSVIDQSASSLNLERVATPSNLTKSKSYSPHKSIFKGHGRKDSMVSFKNFSMSMPSSPRRKSIYNHNSPKKLRLKKNLSLSSIVFKDPEDEIPNLAYVHELQSSPSKRRKPSLTPSIAPQKQPNTPTKSKQFDNVLSDKSNSPESNWSDNSHKSVFPSDVIGEYDKEKWKTMQRLQLVGDHDQ